MKVDYFEAELLPTLKQLLRQPSGSIEYALFQALEEAKAPITTFLDLAPRDGRERQDIESGEQFLLKCDSELVPMSFFREPSVRARRDSFQRELQTWGALSRRRAQRIGTLLR